MCNRPGSRVFFSYSHDSDAHATRVRKLADRLIACGIDCILDQYEPDPPEGWPQWMSRQLDEANLVLVVCTDDYHSKAVARSPQGIGGVKFETVLLVQDLYDTGMWNERFIPVLFEKLPTTKIVRPLRGYTRYLVDSELGFENLLRRLTGQPRHVKPPLGTVPELARGTLDAETPGEPTAYANVSVVGKPATGPLDNLLVPLADSTLTERLFVESGIPTYTISTKKPSSLILRLDFFQGYAAACWPSETSAALLLHAVQSALSPSFPPESFISITSVGLNGEQQRDTVTLGELLSMKIEPQPAFLRVDIAGRAFVGEIFSADQNVALKTGVITSTPEVNELESFFEKTSSCAPSLRRAIWPRVRVVLQAAWRSRP
jgi:hypothetical protein